MKVRTSGREREEPSDEGAERHLLEPKVPRSVGLAVAREVDGGRLRDVDLHRPPIRRLCRLRRLRHVSGGPPLVHACLARASAPGTEHQRLASTNERLYRKPELDDVSPFSVILSPFYLYSLDEPI